MKQALLVLASASPRRRALLSQLGLAFEAFATNADETVPPGANAVAAVSQIARRKVDAYLARADARRDAYVLGVDTEVYLNGRLYGKPSDPASARAMLADLAGNTHVVISALVLRAPNGNFREAAEQSRVTITPLSPQQIESYVASKEPFDKAGGYAVQGQGAALIAGVEGDYTNVVGLPLRATLRLLHEAGFPLPAHLQPS